MTTTSPDQIPTHVAIIMDGNGRWAAARGLPRDMGHRAGVKALRKIVEACPALGINYLTVYAFSTENWQRPPAEVNHLMSLFGNAIERERRDLIKNNVRVRVIGRINDIPERVRIRFMKLIEDTSRNTGLTLTLAVSYGGRAEIVDACNRALQEIRTPLSETDFATLLYEPALPDPDLLIRTGGEMRISNYLLWQLAYTELYFTETLWPDFGPDDLAAAIADFRRRQRRFGRTDG